MGLFARILGRPKLATPLNLRTSIADHVVAQSGKTKLLTANALLLLPGSSATLLIRYRALFATTATDKKGEKRLASKKGTVEAGATLDFVLTESEDHGLLIEQLEPRHALARHTRL